jgi:hypothetical protein
VASKAIWIGIAVGVFFAGIGIGFTVFSPSFSPDNKMMQNQQMTQNLQLRDQIMNQMMENPELMRQWMSTPEHAQQMAQVMRDDHDFMMTMFSQMMSDEQLRLQMLGHMTENSEMMEHMQQMMGKQHMGQEMMNP